MNHLLAFKEYLLALRPQPSKITVKNYTIDVKHFIAWAEEKFNKPFDPKDITSHDIAAFRQDNAARLSTRSLDRHVSSLRKFFQALKMQGTLAQNPFDEEKKAQPAADPFHLKEFKDFLYVYNASNLTIKNYIIDVKQFLAWASEVASHDGIGTNDILASLTDTYVSSYRDRLLAEQTFSPSSINRKLSSLRKYLSWAASQNLTDNREALQHNLNSVQNVISAPQNELPKLNEIEANLPTIESDKNKAHTYSPFPPFRLAQKLGRFGLIIFDTVVASPIASVAAIAQKSLWSLQGKPLFQKQQQPSMLRPIVRVKNISKATYAPLSISTNGMPWYEKIIFHARHTRPQWYKRYHSYALAHYFNWAILMIFMTVIGFGFYNSFVTKPQNGQPLLAATAPPRVLSFQGRLTDSANNPITTATNLRFGIYNDATATGSALLWQEIDNVQPDANGVFSVILGKNTSIPQSLFANNSNLFLGITVGVTPELTPRQQLATVAYATNAETLQGLPPITQSGAGTQNVVLALDSTGNLTIGAASTFQTVGGAFTLSGNSLMLTTNAGTNGNVAINPNGTGFIDLQKPIINSTLNNNIPSAQGAVEVDDNFAVLATTSGIPAVTINQNGSGAIFTASSSGIERFTIGNAGTIKATNYTAQGGVLYTDSTGLFLQTGTSNNTQCLIGGTAPTWTACSNIGQNFWQINNGALVPVNSTVDLFVGGTSTASAKFGVLNINSGTPTASISSGLNGTATFMTADGTIQTANFQGLTIGGTTTGNITLSPQNGSGTVTINGALAITGQLTTSLIPSSTSINLGSPTNPFGNIYLSSTGGIGGYWQLQNGALSPTNIANDVLIGSTASGSARFHAYGTGGTVPAASASAKTSYAALVANNDGVGDVFAASSSSIPVFSIRANGQIVANQYNTAGGVFYANGSGVFTQASNASANTVLHGGATPTFSAVSLTADVSGILPLANGGTNANLTADSGGIVYSGASSLAILAHASSVGQCLVSGGTGAPSWSSCSSAAANWWVMNAGTLFPINNTFDLTLGSSDGTGSSASAKFAVLNMSGSGTPTASVSSGLNGTGMYFDANGEIQTVRNMTMTIGGNTTGNIILAPSNGNGTVTVNGTGLQTNAATFNLLTSTATTVNFAQAANNINVGNAGGTTTFASAAINDNQSTVSLLSSPTTVNFAAGATTALNIGSSTSPTNLNGNVVIGTNNTNTFTPNAMMNVDLIPTGNGAINLGSSSHYYNTVYANNFVAPVSGGTSGFWSLANDVIFPVNTYFDLAIGGTSTASADWQVYSENLGPIVAGTATSSAHLSFRNPATKINLLNGATLDIQTSVGGDSGLASVLNIANNGNMTATGNLALNGGTLSTTQSVASLFNSVASTVNIAGGASTATNIGHASGQIFLRGNVVLGTNNTNTITPNGEFVGSLIPQATNTYDLGTSTLAWKNLYLSGNYDGFWQRFNQVISPYNISDDLAIGGTATGSAPFQVFGLSTPAGAPAGTASTSGQLTFRTSSQVNLLNNATLGFYNSVGGDSGITSSTPALYLASSGNVGVGTTVASVPLTIAAGGTALTLNNGNNSTSSIAFSGGTAGTGRAWVGYDGSFAVLEGSSGHGIKLFASSGSTFSSGNVGLEITGTNAFALMGTTTTGNAQLTVNQTNVSGLGDIFTASAAGVTKFTIANDGTIKNDLIPNITDTYNLGSDPNTGGKEWNNLYVRQIITPATGGIAGFWQLNSGVLAPSNVNNDLAVGGNSTASARFQVYATGTGAGSISATLNNPNTLGSTTSIINLASANHTYMTLNNTDLTIGGHKNANTTITSVQKVYIYDTSKDSDGGNWTNDERAQASSWYNEALNVAGVRGSTRPFPRKAIIVVTRNQSGAILIYDAKDNSLWMQFNKGATTTENMVGPITASPGSSITALNGKLYFASGGINGTAGALYVVDFIHDISYKYTDVGYYTGNLTIANRNTTATYTLYPSVSAILPSPRMMDVSVAVINGSTYIAAATRGGTNGGLALINESLGKLVTTFGPNSFAVNNVSLTSTGDLYAVVCTTAGNPCPNWALKVKHNAESTSLANNTLFDEVYGYQSATNYGVATTDNNTFASIAFTPGPSATTSANLIIPTANGMYVTEGTSIADGVSNTIYLAENGSDGALAAIQEKQASPAAGTIKYYKNNFITEEMVGDTRGMWPLSSNAASVSGTLIGNILDASVQGNVASESGRPTYVSGVRDLGLSFNGTNQYLSCNNAQCGAATDLGLNGGRTISVGAWVKTSASGVTQMVLSKFNQGVGGAYYLQVNSAGKAVFAVNGPANSTTVSVQTVNDGNWHYLVGTYDNANSKIYVDGQIGGIVSTTGTFGNNGNLADFFIGADQVSNAVANFFNGSIDEPFVSASVLSGSDIAHMYQVGYRALQNHASQTIRGVTIAADASQNLTNSNGNVNAVTASVQNGQIYVGTNNGGISVIGMDSDTVKDLYNTNITTTDDTGASLNSFSNFSQSIALGQSYGNGTILAFGGDSAGNSGMWFESQDTTLKDIFATNYNPFGATLNQNNLNIDNVLRVTSQLSTRLDNLAYNATSAATLNDIFRVDGNGLSMDVQSTTNSPAAFISQTLATNPGGFAAALNVVKNYTGTGVQSGFEDINASGTLNGSGTITTMFNLVSNPSITTTSTGTITNGTGLYVRMDNNSKSGGSVGTWYGIHVASASGDGIIGTQYAMVTDAGAGNVGLGTTTPTQRLDVNGAMTADQFLDRQNNAYFLDPASTGTSLTVAGSIGVDTTSPDHLITMQVASGVNAGWNIRDTTTDATHIQYAFEKRSDNNQFWIWGYDGTTFWNPVKIDYTNKYVNLVGDTVGNVGIGNVTPGAQLTVGPNLTGAAMSTVFRTNSGSLGTTGGNEIGPMASFMFTNSNVGSLGIRGYREANGTDWQTAGVKLSYDVDASEAVNGGYVTIEHNGRVGISTQTPNYRLEVSGDTYTNGGWFRVAGNNGYYWETNGIGLYTQDASWIRSYPNGGSVGFWANNGTFGTNGKLSIGLGGGTWGAISVDSCPGSANNLEHNGCNAFEYDSNGTAQAMYGGTDPGYGANNGRTYIQSVRPGVGVARLSINARGGPVDLDAGAGNFDYAEIYHSNQVIKPGELVQISQDAQYNGTIDNNGITIDASNSAYFNHPETNNGKVIERTTSAYSPAVIGVASTHPAVIINDTTVTFDKGTAVDPAGSHAPPIDLAGRAPVNVSTSNGPIHNGDPITSSNIAGFGMKATKPGYIVGRAMQEFDPANGKTGDIGIIACPAGTAANVVCGQVYIYATTTWSDPDVYIASTGDLSFALASPSVNFAVPSYYTLNDALGNPVTRMGAFVELVAGNLRVGAVNAQQVFTNSLAIATDNVFVAGQSLRDYILNVVRTSDLIQNGTLSPIAAVDQIHTNLISPLASDSAIAIDLQNSQFTIRNSATGSAVATIDNTGNATFSGTLNSKNLAVNADATVAGTLRAHRIVADDIEGLSAAVGTLSAQNITNVTNIYFATPSGTPSGGNYAMGQSGYSSSPSGLLTPYLGYTNIASYSSFLAYVPNLSASTAMFDSGLTSLGPTALSDTTITGQLSIGTSLILANNSLNVLGSSFEIQPLRQGGVNFEGGLLAIDTDGNLTVNGNAVFAKTLAAHLISPLSNNDNLTFQLGQNSTATGSALATSNLSVQNASGSGIFTVDQLGNLVASGAANIAKLNFNLVQPALAVSDTEVIATGSAGTATIKAHQTEVTIDNPLVTDKSLIYITPVGQSGVTPYLIRQVKGTSFTAGISLPQYADTTFNWLIIN